MANCEEDKIVDEAKERLNDIFGGLEDEPGSLKECAGSPEDSLTDLKSAILTLDWEINDELLDQLVGEARRLKQIRQQDKYFPSFMQLIETIVNYIRISRENTHPEVMKLLISIYYDLEEIFISKDLSESQKWEKLKIQIDNLKKLKGKISKIEKKKGDRSKAQAIPQSPSTKVDKVEESQEAEEVFFDDEEEGIVSELSEKIFSRLHKEFDKIVKKVIQEELSRYLTKSK